MTGGWIALLAATLLAACQPTDPRPPVARAASAHDLELGRKVYNFRCYYCHGYSGDARTLATSFLAPKPRDFTGAEAARLSREQIMRAIRDGRPGSAMAAFAGTLSDREIAAVADFIRDEFIRRKAENTRYHTTANGWPGHERYRAAFPFATGEIALGVPVDALTPEQAAGRRLFMNTCVSCHDRGRPTSDGTVWDMRAVSYPPNADACAGCHRYSAALHGWDEAKRARIAGVNKAYPAPGSPFASHDASPRPATLDDEERRGELLFQRNCTFCHAADGSGKNWIGAFLEPHPQDLSDRRFMSAMSRSRLEKSVREGVPGTSMPAWKSVLADDEIDALVAYLARTFGPLAD